jgi:hypothetical protein
MTARRLNGKAAVITKSVKGVCTENVREMYVNVKKWKCEMCVIVKKWNVKLR